VTSPCTGIPGRTVAASMDGHAGLLVRFTGDVEAFILVNNRMYVVAEWRPDNDQTDLKYPSGTLLVEDFLSTMRLLPGGPGASASPGRPEKSPGRGGAVGRGRDPSFGEYLPTSVLELGGLPIPPRGRQAGAPGRPA
jgi:hypothetical protein